MVANRNKIRLGDLLVEKNVITSEQLNSVLAEQRQIGGKLGDLLVARQVITEQHLLDFLAEQLNIPFIDLAHYDLKPELIKLLPETYARRFRAIVIDKDAKGLMVGMVDPQDIFAFDEISRVLKLPFELALVREADLLRSIDLYYRHSEEITHLAAAISEEIEEKNFDIAELSKDLAADAPVVKLLQTLFEDAVQAGASDIHIEPDESVLRIRQRIDGVLHEQIMKETRIAPSLTLRLKLMASINIVEKRVPQDGRFSVKVKGRTFDVRLSTVPVQYGESIVMRLLDRSSVAAPLEELGLPEAMQAKLRRIISLPYGMILITGPTGSGKTTTCYSLLSELNTAEKKIVTAEDPIEYRLSRANQIQVNPHVNLGFVEILRALVRQDPDVILIGEIRDQETTKIGLQAAMTGHLVLATLHTNDAISAAARLLNMEGEGFIIASALKAVLAQRLLRRICNNCIAPYQLTAQEQTWFLNNAPQVNFNAQHFQQGNGCAHCNNTGYRGRVGVYELLEITPSMASALRQNNLAEFTKAAEAQLAHQFLKDAALSLVIQGITTLSEVLRVIATDASFSLAKE